MTLGGCKDNAGSAEYQSRQPSNFQSKTTFADVKVASASVLSDPSPSNPKWKRVRQELLLSEYVDVKNIVVEGDRVSVWTIFDLNKIQTHRKFGVDYYSHKELRNIVCSERVSKTLLNIFYEGRMGGGNFNVLDVKSEWISYGEYDLAMAFVCNELKSDVK